MSGVLWITTSPTKCSIENEVFMYYCCVFYIIFNFIYLLLFTLCKIY